MLNPDGHRLVVDWYNRNKGTPFEGGPMPWPDHKYAGHDINRDAFMMNLAESRNLARFFYREWHPHVFLSMHQMDDGGARFFAPPVADPIDANVDPIAWREAALLGSAMTLQLERDGRTGVVSGSFFDYYSPGYEDTAPLGHNTVCPPDGSRPCKSRDSDRPTASRSRRANSARRRSIHGRAADGRCATSSTTSERHSWTAAPPTCIAMT